ncbi:MAG: radical SAM protein, partial [Acetobacteraceae bacterium]
MECLSRHFLLADDCEAAIELDPRRLSPALFAARGAMCVTRVSLGVQDFDPRAQQAVRRVQPFTLVAETVEALRRAGTSTINFDLMYGLPYQTVESVAASAAEAGRLGPERLAVSGYAHVPCLKPYQNLLPAKALPDARSRHAQQRAVANVLVGAGYPPIGLDHFARPGDALLLAAASGNLRRNFQGYTDDPAPVLLGREQYRPDRNRQMPV